MPHDGGTELSRSVEDMKIGRPTLHFTKHHLFFIYLFFVCTARDVQGPVFEAAAGGCQKGIFCEDYRAQMRALRFV